MPKKMLFLFVAFIILAFNVPTAFATQVTADFEGLGYADNSQIVETVVADGIRFSTSAGAGMDYKTSYGEGDSACVLAHYAGAIGWVEFRLGDGSDFSLTSLYYNNIYSTTAASTYTFEGYDGGSVAYSKNNVDVSSSGTITFTGWSNVDAVRITAVAGAYLDVASTFDSIVYEKLSASAVPYMDTNQPATVIEGGTVSITNGNLKAADNDSDNSTLQYTITSLPAHGRLEKTSVPGTAITTFTQGDIDSGIIRYVHNHSDTTSDSFIFKVSDGVNELTNRTFNITVTPVYDDPIPAGASVATFDNLGGTFTSGSPIPYSTPIDGFLFRSSADLGMIYYSNSGQDNTPALMTDAPGNTKIPGLTIKKGDGSSFKLISIYLYDSTTTGSSEYTFEGYLGAGKVYTKSNVNVKSPATVTFNWENINEIRVTAVTGTEPDIAAYFDNIIYQNSTPTDIASAGVTGISAPAAGAAPALLTSLTPGHATYAVTNLTWQNADGSAVTLVNGKFKAGSSYKAIIELTASAGYKFPAGGLTPTVNAGTTSPGSVGGGDVSGNKLTFTVTFPGTAALAATGIAVKTQPALSYVEGDLLNLSGLAVTLTYNDTSTADVAFTDFAANSITANPDSGTAMTVAGHNGHQIELACNGNKAYTNALAVQAVSYTVEANVTSLSFGSAIEGYTPPATKTVIITNTGNKSVTLNTPTNAYFYIATTDPLTLAPAGTAHFLVQPKTGLAVNAYSEDISFTTLSSTSDSVNVTFTVQAATYTVEANVTSLSFASAIEGYASAPAAQTVTITNMGNKNVTLSMPTNTHFDITTTDSLTLAPAGTAHFSVQPKIALAVNAYSEDISFSTTNGTSDSVNVSFTVQAATYTVEAAPASLSFASAIEGYAAPFPQTVTITNTGNKAVTLITPTNAAFNIISIDSLTLAPAGSAHFAVQTKTNLTANAYSEDISFSTTNGTSDSVNVSFTVLAATYTVEADVTSLSFASAIEGYTSAPTAQTVTITNNGNSAVTLSLPTVTGYTLGTLSATSLAAGASATFTVQPIIGLGVGTHSETITVSTDHSTSVGIGVTFTVQSATYAISADPASLSFDSLIEGYATLPTAKMVTITNDGNSTVALTQPTSTKYTIGTLSSTSLAAGASATFTVQPTLGLGAGTHSETITVSTDHSASVGVSVTFTVQSATYAISADPASLSFDSLIEGYASTPTAKTVTITNNGNSPVTLTQPTSTKYTITALSSTSLAAGASATFTVQPMIGLGVGTNSETITVNTNHLTSVGVSVTFTVQSASYVVEADVTSLSFAGMVEGYATAPAAQTVIITNMGNKSVTLITPTSTHFEITTTDSLTLAPAGTAHFSVQPKIGLPAVAYNEDISFSTTSSTSDSVNVNFTVQSASYAVEANVTSLSFGSAIEGYTPAPTAQTVTITNMGNKSVTLITPTSTHFDITSTDSLTLAPAGTAQFNVQPNIGLAAYAYSEDISFSTTSATYDSVNVSFTVQSASYAISANPFLKVFLSAAQGEAPPAEETITITNDGNKTVTLTQPTATNYTVGTLSVLSIAPLETATFTVRPNSGLAEGSYTETITVQGSNGASANVEVRFTVTEAASYAIIANPADMAFDSLAEGYIVPDTKMVTVTNTGNQSISLYPPAAAHYTFGPLSGTALAPGDSATFTVVPKAGLSVGTWNETIQILGSNGVNAQVDAAFTCTVPLNYFIISGDGSAFQQDDPDPSSVSITANGHISNFTGLTLNGELVDESNYDVTEGSTIVTLHQDFLDTLIPGTYTLSFIYTDGIAEAEFVVQDYMPVTGDNDALIVFGTLMVLSLIALIYIRNKQALR